MKKKEIEVRKAQVVLFTEKKDSFLWDEDIKMILPLIEAEASRLFEKSSWTKTEPAKASDMLRIAKKFREILE